MRVSEPEIGVFAGYNARGKTPKQVASTFLAPGAYWRLTTSDNQTLVGPRGSGKTSLLKMLVDEGLDAWEGSDGQRAREEVNFTGVLVPADKLWAGQLRDVTHSLPFELRYDFGDAAFSLMALSALATAAHRRVYGPFGVHKHNKATLSPEKEADICGLVAPNWAVPAAVASLATLRDLATHNVAVLSRLGRQAARPGRRERAIAKLKESPLLDVDFYSAASEFVSLFNNNSDSECTLWAFLIDELEFLPPETKSHLRDSVRGFDPNVIFKISLAPYTHVSGSITQPLEGMPFADYDSVPLGRWRRKQDDPFVEKLFEQAIAQHRVDEDSGEPETLSEGDVTARSLLGPGGFEAEDSRDNYTSEGTNGKLIRELASFDIPFAEYLDGLGVDPGDLDSITERQYDRLRACIPIVKLRLEYWKPDDDGERVRRSRKGFRPLYVGRESILAMSEGNPRWINALAYALRSRWSGEGQIPASRQLDAVSEVSSKYLEYLRAVDIDHQMDQLYESAQPEKPTEGEPVPYSIQVRVGRFFEEVVHRQDSFSPEPSLAFYNNEGDELTTGVLQALIFLGAIVVDGLAEGREDSRLRIAHLFAPEFKLPLRSTSAIALDKILAETRVEPEEEPEPPQLDLLESRDDERMGG